ncbi:MAG: hypothetical protein K2N06_00215 [Oscillospiraceae bacterium]|nr:hypothetical protein [Oscillospiraceae bacterium]
MKKHFWKISALACAAMVSACAVTASAANIVDSSNYGKCFTESGEECPTMTAEEVEARRKQEESEYYADPRHTVAPYMLETTESGLTVYEEALLAGDYSLRCGTVECSGKHIHPTSDISEEKRWNAAAVSSESKEITLDKVDDVEYNLWSGRHTYYGDLKTFQWYSNSPGGFDISGDGRKITMHSQYSYRTLFKKVIVNLSYLKNGKITHTTTSAEGTSQDIVVTGNSSGGELVEIAAYFYLYNVSDESEDFKEVAVVHILHENYVPLAIENGEPYAHLIDEYTPI